jgi:hypothetical protein
MRSLAPGHRKLLDTLVQYACQAAILTTTEPPEHVPADLKDLLLSLQQVEVDYPLHQSCELVKSCAPALISVARLAPDLFPQPLARGIVHDLDHLRLWEIVCDVEGLDVDGIDVSLINGQIGSNYLWRRLDACTPNATELLIAPQVFRRILNSYEEQVEEARRTDVEDVSL